MSGLGPRTARKAGCVGALLWAAALGPVALGADEPSPNQHEFVVGIEDRLHIVVWGEPELSLIVAVRPDGKISLPLINDIAVAGLAPETIRDRIAKKLAGFVREPNVTVIVDQMNSFRVYFLGEVHNQGALQFFQPTRLLQGIAAAGGLTEFAKKRITLVREQDGMEKRLDIDYKQLVTGPPGQENFYLKPGDTLIFH